MRMEEVFLAAIKHYPRARVRSGDYPRMLWLRGARDVICMFLIALPRE